MEYKRLIVALSNFSKFFGTNNKYDTKNINQIYNAITKWTNSHKNIKINKYKVGDIYKIEFGLAYEPEMAFEHRGLVLGKNNNLYYVLPITTYNKNKNTYNNAYHSKDNPNGDKNYYLLKKNKQNYFLDHDSIIKCNDLKTISYKRFAGNKIGNIDNQDLESILSIVYRNIFPTIDYKMNNKLEQYENKIKLLEDEIINLKSIIKQYDE